jgi:predicted HicB family RNase H-like nuclease
MVPVMNEKVVRKSRNVKIDPEAIHRARVEALIEKRTLGEWLEEAIDEKIRTKIRRKRKEGVK